ncbi:MAG: hypothetical protein IT372_31190 [Polyangiaceae bacterium]|nr:hypothetical protein [Polyangiaceae bacterium]
MIDETAGAMARAWNWSAVLKGSFLALALYVLLRFFGAALGVSTGNRVLETGFAVWSVIVQLVAIGSGAALAGYLISPSRAVDGVLTGVFTWVVSIVLMATLFGVAGPQTARSALWGAFLGALLSVGAGAIGGLLGVQIGRRSRRPAYAGPTVVTPATPEPPPKDEGPPVGL